jgi:hypothetical protein
MRSVLTASAASKVVGSRIPIGRYRGSFRNDGASAKKTESKVPASAVRASSM